MRSQRPLGRVEPKEFDHVEKYPLLLSTVPPKAVPVVWGITWYDNFDKPVKGKDGKWRIGTSNNLGPIRGGHAIMSPHDNSDLYAWYLYYNQLKEGACVGFSLSHMMSMLNRERYDGLLNYRAARLVDEFPGENYDGTTLKAGCDVLRTQGPFCPRKKVHCLDDGIIANRWARDVVEALEALKNPAYIKAGEVPLSNSWGKDYPRKVWISLDILQRLMNEGGECVIVTDK